MRPSLLKRCTVCEVGILAPKTVYEDIKYLSWSIRVPVVCSKCERCGSESISFEQQEENDRVMQQFKDQLDAILDNLTDSKNDTSLNNK